MGRQVGVVLFVLALVVSVVCVDVLFFRQHLVPRLIANLGIVVAFGAFYFLFLRHR